MINRFSKSKQPTHAHTMNTFSGSPIRNMDPVNALVSSECQQENEADDANEQEPNNSVPSLEVCKVTINR